MSFFRIIFDHATIYHSDTNIVAPIYFDFGDVQFPEAGWSDFPVIIASWWLNEVYALFDENKASGDLVFMDGPMRVRLLSISSQDFELECIQLKPHPTDIYMDKEELEFCRIVSKVDFCSELKRLVYKILSFAEGQHWENKFRDLTDLKSALLQFEKLEV